MLKNRRLQISRYAFAVHDKNIHTPIENNLPLYVTERIIYSIGTGSIFLRISANYHGIQLKIGQFSEIICPSIRYKKNHGGKRPKYI